MAKFVFNTCCCCIELRTGCLIIGYLNLISSLVIIAFSIFGKKLIAQLIEAHQAIAGVQMESSQLNQLTILAGVVFLLVGLFGFAMSIVLLVGVHKKKRRHLKVYLIMTAVILVIHLIQIIVTAALDNRHKAVIAGEAVRNLLQILLCSYLVNVIRSYYYKIDEEKQKP